MDRSELLKRMDELLPVGYKDAPQNHVETLTKQRAETLKWAESATDDQISDWIAETEMSADFWDRWDSDMARDLAPGGRYAK